MSIQTVFTQKLLHYSVVWFLQIKTHTLFAWKKVSFFSWSSCPPRLNGMEPNLTGHHQVEVVPMLALGSDGPRSLCVHVPLPTTTTTNIIIITEIVHLMVSLQWSSGGSPERGNVEKREAKERVHWEFARKKWASILNASQIGFFFLFFLLFSIYPGKLSKNSQWFLFQWNKAIIIKQQEDNQNQIISNYFSCVYYASGFWVFLWMCLEQLSWTVVWVCKFVFARLMSKQFGQCE